MKLSCVIIIFLEGFMFRTFACLRKYVPDLDDADDIIPFGKIQPRIVDTNCECGSKPDTPASVSEEFPWIVEIVHESTNKAHKCWGSIINDRFLITSVKCLVDFEDLTLANNLLRSTKFDLKKIQIIPVISLPSILMPKTAKCHPMAVPTYFLYGEPDYDICIIELVTKIEGTFSPICIPDLSDIKRNFVGQKIDILGLEHGSTAKLEKQESLIYDPNNICKEHNGIVWCTQYGTQNPFIFAFENIGGPVVLNLKSGKSMQIGITSYKKIHAQFHPNLEATPLEFSSDLANKQIVSFINKESESAKVCFCQAPSTDLALDTNPSARPLITTDQPWKDFTPAFRKTTKSCRCGVRNSVSSLSNVRIVGGDPAKRNEYRWQVQILTQLDPNDDSSWELCGGTIINSKIVMTAAHCVVIRKLKRAVSPEKVKIHVNAHEGFVQEESSRRTLSVDFVYAHPQFVKHHDFSFDIALLHLNESLEFSQASNIFPVCLPTADEFGPDNEQLVGKSALVIGWSYTNPNKESLASELQELVVPIRRREECNTDGFTIPDTMICAGHLLPPENYKDPSHGDSGGPLMLTLPSKSLPLVDQLVEVGIVSAGTYSQSEQKPAVWYTSVKEYLPYIDFFSIIAGGVWCSR